MTYNRKLTQFTLAFLLSALFLAPSLLAQTDKIAFEKYGVTEGLPEEAVSSMVQDDQGFIWAATQNGLVKFDGYKMKVYKGSDYKLGSEKLGFRNVGSLIKSKSGNLWMGSVSGNGGIGFFNPKTEKFKSYISNSKDSTNIYFEDNLLLFEDTKENIWFTSYTGTKDSSVVGRLNTKTHQISTYPYKNINSKKNDFVSNEALLEFETDHSVWLRDDMGNINVLNREKDVFEMVIPSGSEILGSGIKDTIQNIYKGNKDHFILSGQHGFYLWDPITRKSIKSYTNLTDKDNSLSSDTFMAAFEDSQGQIWAEQTGGVLTIFNPKTNTATKLKSGEGPLYFKNAIKNTWGFWPLLDTKKGLWLQIWDGGTEDAFIYYEFSTKTFSYYSQQFNDTENPFPKDRVYYQMLQDKTGLLYLYRRPNFYKQSPKTRQMALYQHDAADELSIPSNNITSLFEDSKNRIWVVTGSGLSVKRPNNEFQQFYFKDKTGLKKELGGVFKIYEDSKKRIWICSYESDGLLKLNETTQEFELTDFYRVTSIQEDSKGNIWINSWRKGTYILDGNTTKVITKFEPNTIDTHGLLSAVMWTMFLDSRGTMWLGDRGDNEFGLFRYNEKEQNFKHYKRTNADSTGLNSNEIHEIIEDDHNRIWVATDGGVNLYDHEKDIFYKHKQSFDISSVRTITKATNGRIWAATYASGGLALVGPGINDIEMFGEDKGLLHNDVSNLILDDYGKLWLPTQRGLSVLDTLTKTYSSYFEKDGFQKYSRSSTTIKTHDGDIWIGGENGLNHIVPAKLAKKDMTVPSVFITSIGILDSIYSKPDGKLFNKAVSYTDKVKIKHWQKDISFNFVALHFLNPEDNEYSWKLENYDTKWSTPSKERQAGYTNLSPGRYTFKVKASNADGIWNEEGASLEIVIASPWWFSWWAFALYGLLFLFVVYYIFSMQRQKTLRKEREKTQQKELEQAKEIEKAYTDLKATQSQLIQSEKMASLGELTAGIAHEIQNPLNFVNNFAEVSNELIDEMNEELDKGDIEEAKTISVDIKQNLEKINHHGKRADSIVKGMLQHSQNSTGKKEPTNINALADEYLRLAYHGLRAKDKSFNATLETHFDETIGKIDVLPQDMGRVILNLITNAFYASNERKQISKNEAFKPTVSVSTKKVKDSIQITVTDNGNGIPKEIVDKIFQPFFTTKPTGQGTGLGLSMSYDIIKAHNGTLKVATEEGKGTTFTIQLTTL